MSKVRAVQFGPRTRLSPAERAATQHSAFLRSVYQWQYPQGLATPLRLPVCYYDNTFFGAVFTASTARVEEVLPLSEMRPVEVVPGRAAVTFTAFEYRATDIGAYNEFSIAFPITFGRRSVPLWSLARMAMARCFSVYVWQLPVTTEIARWGGVELYGYPKFLADIEFTRERATIACRLSENDAHVLTLAGPVLASAPAGRQRIKTYSVIEDIPLCANVYANRLDYAEALRPAGVTLELGTDHPIGQQLCDLEISPRALAYQYCPHNELILFAPRNLIDG